MLSKRIVRPTDSPKSQRAEKSTDKQTDKQTDTLKDKQTVKLPNKTRDKLPAQGSAGKTPVQGNSKRVANRQLNSPSKQNSGPNKETD